MTKVKIEITIPVFNEEATLEKQVNILYEFLETNLRRDLAFRIVIADNGSTDSTLLLAHNLALTNEKIRVVEVHKKGVGLALRTSWHSSRAEIIGYMDLDLATELKYVDNALTALLDSSGILATGNRLAKESNVVGRSLVRSFTSRVFNFILRAVFRTKIEDAMCGFKFLYRQYLPELEKSGAMNDGWFYATELLLVSESLGLNVVQIPVIWNDDGNSKVKIGRVTTDYLKAIYKLRENFISNGFSSFVRI